MRAGQNRFLLICNLGFTLIGFAALGFANTAEAAKPKTPPAFRFESLLSKDASNEKSEQHIEAIFLSETVSRYASDTVTLDPPILHREPESNALLDAIVSNYPKVLRIPVLMGASGVGKTAIVDRAVQKTLSGMYPSGAVHSRILKDAIWIETNPTLLSAQVQNDTPGDYLQLFRGMFGAIQSYEKQLKRRIILVMDQIHTISSNQSVALNVAMSRSDTPILVGTAPGEAFALAFKNDSAFRKLTYEIGVQELLPAQVMEVLNKTWVPKIQAEFSVLFAKGIVPLLVQNVARIRPGVGALDAAIPLLRDLAVSESRSHNAQTESSGTAERYFLPITLPAAQSFLSRIAGYPINPRAVVDKRQFASNLLANVSAEVVGQKRMVSEITELALSLQDDSSKGLAIAVVSGPSGTGKTELGRSLAKHLFGSPEAFLEIDANEYSSNSEGLSLMKLFGAENGIETATTNSGVISEFFDDPARGKNHGLILVNEAEHGGSFFWNRLGEFFDRGHFTGGDGKKRIARNHIVILTSNRGDQIIFPPGSENWPEEELNARIQKFSSHDIKKLFQRKISGKDQFRIPGSVLNRVDLFTLSKPHTLQSMRDLTAGVLDRFARKERERNGMNWSFGPDVIPALIPKSPDRTEGARPLVFQTQQLLTHLKDAVYSQASIKKNTPITVGVQTEDGVPRALVAGKARADLPEAPIEDPLRDPRIRRTLRDFPAILRGHLIGQERAIDAATIAVTAHLATPHADKRPLSFMAVGPTGNGKTEFGKGLAHALYGSPERATILSVGRIDSHHKLAEFFGTSPGVSGHDEERAFEQALIANPEGGVLVLDEASNMGGNDPALKNALFKTLYEITEEGKWTSSATGVTYDMRNFTLLFTGNDGEELFNGQTADEIRLSIWEDNRDHVGELLLKAGIPEAFLGRMANVFLFKPLLRSEVARIVERKLKPVLQSFEKLGYAIELQTGFIEKLAEVFFGPQKGARSLRDLTERRLRGLISSLLVQQPAGSGSGQRLVLSASDTSPRAPFLINPALEPKIFLKVELRNSRDETVAQAQDDATSLAEFPKRLPVRTAIMVAYHEAGHAVLNQPQISGTKLSTLTILGDRDSLGYAFSKHIPGGRHKPQTRRSAVHNIAMLMAGQVAVMLIGSKPNSGWGADLEMARQTANGYLRELGFGPGLTGLATDENGKTRLSPKQEEMLRIQVSEMIREGIELAESELRKNWQLVFLTARTLLSHGTITGDQFDALKKNLVAPQRTSRPKLPIQEGHSCADLLMPE